MHPQTKNMCTHRLTWHKYSQNHTLSESEHTDANRCVSYVVLINMQKHTERDTHSNMKSQCTRRLIQGSGFYQKQRKRKGIV